MNPTELKDLANTLNGIADGRQWQVFSDSAWRSCSGDPMRLIVSSFKIRLKPWELTDTVNGHTLPTGAEWHRQDFPESMLPQPYRPLMKGEVPIVGDQYCSSLSSWLPIGDKMRAQPAEFWPELWHRTTRPIPATEPQWLPLGPEDVPPFSVIRRKGQTDEYDNLQYWHWRLISYVTGIGPVCADRGYNWQELSTDYEINRAIAAGKWDPIAWEPCRKLSNV